MIEFEILQNKLRDLISRAYTSFAGKIKADSELYEAVMFYTNDLDSKIKIKTRVYRIITDIDYIPVCLNCGRQMLDRDVKNVKEGYRKYCCQQCAKDSPFRKELYENTCMKTFGFPNASSSEIVKAKRIETNLKNLGVDNPAKSSLVMSKIHVTNTELYGCACAIHSEFCSGKTAQTLMTKYGVTSYSKTQEFKDKTIASNRKNFGVDYPNQDPEFRRKSQKRYTYKGMHFDSSPELAFFIYAEDCGIEIEYQPDASFQYEVENRNFIYQPDFKVGSKFVEIKGLQFFENRDPTGKMINPYDRSQDDIYEAKHQCMIRNGVEIVTDYSKYVKYVKSAYGANYMKGFKNT